uniref:Uncharacterized protein n=1 Tax=Pithovirus LCPAC406 TaxID=2506599 RepID=A0A481ZED3_9VIRU|nr:MAG: uncharacterized protein LCPAC406_00890 [Pithovirus LCPAC406]
MDNLDTTFSQNSVVLLTQDMFEEEKEKRSMMTLFYTDSTLTKLWGAVASQTPGPLFSAVKQVKTGETSKTLILVCREGISPEEYCGEITFNAIAEYALKEFY